MAQPFIGEIRMFGSNFAPAGWMFCNGQTLSIAQYTALFSLIGTTYGGNGTSTFNLPDLRGRLPVHQGQGPGLSFYTIGQAAGVETVALNSTQMPQHSHALMASTATATLSSPTNNVTGAAPQTPWRPTFIQSPARPRRLATCYRRPSATTGAICPIRT